MIDVLIVDDEKIIRKGLMNLIDWQKLGFRIIGDAEDGQRALDVFREKHPQLIITDIRMPFMDGLELIKCVKSEAPGTFCIILSGYDEFDYARRAIDFGAYSYILKPIEPAILIEKIDMIKQEINKIIEEKAKYDSLVDEVKKKERIELNYFFFRLINGSFESERDPSLIVKHNIEINYYCVSVIRLSNPSDLTKMTGFLHRIIDLNEYVENFSWIKYRSNSVLLWSHHPNHEKLAQSMRSMIELIQNSNVLDGALITGIGSCNKGLSGIITSFNDALQSASYRFVNDAYGMNSSVIQEETGNDLTEMIDRVVHHLKNGNKEGIIESITLYEEGFSKAELTGRNQLFSIFILKIFDFISQSNHNIGEIFENPIDLINDFSSGQDYHLSIRKLENILVNICDYFSSKMNNRYSNIIERSVDYILENLGNPALSLVSVANYVSLSPNYYSTLFSKEKKISFMKFLINARVTKAIELFKENKYTAYEISDLVGYDNYTCFSSIFKKTTGLSPKNYMKQL